MIKKSATQAAMAERKIHLALIHERGYDHTSVEDICSAAGVSRSGFYAHFSGKDDLKRSGLRALERQLLALQQSAAAEAGPSFSFSLPLFEHAHDHL
jgi:AcrR family transcriptional regulator